MYISVHSVNITKIVHLKRKEILIILGTTKFLRLIRKGWRPRTRQICYMCTRNVLKYSDFIFYVATRKTTNSILAHFLDDLSTPLTI